MSFIGAFFLFLALIVGLLAAIAGLYIYWRYYLSAPIIDSTEIGVIKHRGRPETVDLGGGRIGVRIYPPGSKPFVPWIPIKFPGGYYLYELVRIPSEQLPIPYDLPKDREYFWTSNSQRVLGQVILYVAFPTGDGEALLKVLTFGVPTFVEDRGEKKGLKSFFEEFVMSKVRRIISKSTDTDITGSKDSLEQDILVVFKDRKSLPMRCGLYGSNPDDDTPGTGYVYLDMEQVEIDEELRKKYQEELTAAIDVRIAKSRAATAAQNAGVVPKAYAEWLRTPEGAAATEELKKLVFEAIRQGKLSSDGRYNEQLIRKLIGSPDGGPLPSSLVYYSDGTGGGGGVLFSGGQQGNRGDPDDDILSKDPATLSEEDLKKYDDAVRRRKKNKKRD